MSRPALERIHDAIKAGEGSSAVYDRFNVGQYTCSRVTFARYWRRRRREWEDRQELAADRDRQVTAEELVLSLLESVQVSLDAGRKIDGGVVKAITACVSTLKLDLDRESDRRAAEKHEAWKAELAKKQSAALEAVSNAAQLTPEQVAEIRLKVLGL